MIWLVGFFILCVPCKLVTAFGTNMFLKSSQRYFVISKMKQILWVLGRCIRVKSNWLKLQIAMYKPHTHVLGVIKANHNYDQSCWQKLIYISMSKYDGSICNTTHSYILKKVVCVFFKAAFSSRVTIIKKPTETHRLSYRLQYQCNMFTTTGASTTCIFFTTCTLRLKLGF